MTNDDVREVVPECVSYISKVPKMHAEGFKHVVSVSGISTQNTLDAKNLPGNVLSIKHDKIEWDHYFDGCISNWQ